MRGEGYQAILGSFLTCSLGWTSILTSMATCKPSTIRTETLVLCACSTCLGEAFFPPQGFPKCLLCAGAIPGIEVMVVSNTPADSAPPEHDDPPSPLF